MNHTKTECKCGDCQICNGGLFVCSVCNCAEGTLPTECPGVVVPMEVQESHQGLQDFKNGELITTQKLILTGETKMFLPHQQRVIDEKVELGKKISSLIDFIFTNQIFQTLSDDAQLMLKRQLVAMDEYYTILVARMSQF